MIKDEVIELIIFNQKPYENVNMDDLMV